MAVAHAAYILHNCWHKLKKYIIVRIKECFDLIAGTSTGAIIAGAAVAEIPMTEIVELFESEALRYIPKKVVSQPSVFQ